MSLLCHQQATTLWILQVPFADGGSGWVGIALKVCLEECASNTCSASAALCGPEAVALHLSWPMEAACVVFMFSAGAILCAGCSFCECS